MKKITLLIIFAMTFCYNQNIAQTLDSNAVDGKIYIKIKDYSSFVDLTYNGGDQSGLPVEVTAIVNSYSVTSIDRPFLSAGDSKLNRVFRVSFTDFKSINRVIESFGSIDYIEYSEKIPVDKISCTSDPGTWGITSHNYHLNLIQACNAWSINQGSNLVRVAILDNECDVNHTDLIGRVSLSYDIADNDAIVLAPSYINHGTHVTGIVGANTNNGTGVAALGRGLDLIFGKIAQDATGQLTAGYPAMIWAVNNGARVINCSWGGFYYSQTNSLVVNWVISQNVIICAAAGNSNINAPNYPAAFPGVYAVGASDAFDNKASFSNWGPWVDIAAPGVGIFSTISSAVSGVNAYAQMSGTSMASPMVAALCGLVISNNPLYTPAMVLNCISTTSSPTFGNPIGSGRINAFAALQCSSGSGNVVQFSASSTHVCNNSSVSFTDNSVTTSPITSWSWTFSNLNNTITSNLQNPVIAFTSPGIYSAALTVTTMSGLTYTTFYPTDIYVVGLNNAAFSSTGLYCKNNESQVSFTFDRFPELVINYNINGGAVNTLSLTSQYVSTQDLMFNTPNAASMNFNISSVSDNVITCPTSINFSTVLVDCCPNLVNNGNFELGNNISYTSDLTNCFNTYSPGYTTTYYYSQNVLSSVITPRGLQHLFTDGPITPPSPTVGACNPPLTVPLLNNPGYGVKLYEGTVNLIAGSDYILSFVHTNPNIPFYSGIIPLIYPYASSNFRVSLVGSSGTVFITNYSPNPSNDFKWYQFKRDLSGLITATGSYSIIIEQIDNFNGSAYDYGFDDVSVNAINNLTSNITPNLTNLCVASNVNLTASSPNAVGTLAYSWSSVPASTYPNTQSINPLVSVNTVFTSTIQDANLCTVQSTAIVDFSSCPTCTNCIPAGVSGTMAGGNLVSNVYCLNNNLLITGNVIMINSELKVGANWNITISPTGNLRIINSHLYSCKDMWQGIIIQNGGKLTVSGSLIEDAFVAIDVTGNTQSSNVFTLTNSTLNRNDIGINIKGYTQTNPSYPFKITNCVITCRNIPFVVNSRAFPSANSIGSSFSNPGAPFTNSVIDNGTYAQTLPVSPPAFPNMPFLKAPFVANTKPTAGIRLTQVGVTQNPQTTTPTYFEFVLGGPANKNIIDNQRVGVDLIQSNYSSYNAIYQNMVTFGGHGSQGGIGINANAIETGNFRLQVTSTNNSSAFGNQFVDCSRAINSVNYFEHIITFNDIRSSQINTAPVASLPNGKGKFGVKSITNRFRIYNVSINTIYNIENGIIMDGTFGPLSIPTVPTNGQYAGKINIDNNTIAPQIGTAAITSQYVSNAISLSNISGGYYPANSPYPIFQTANNSISNAYRGILYKNWHKINDIINSNVITLVNDPYVVNNLQYGIAMNLCDPASGQSSVRSNAVTGYGITNPKLYGIVSSQSPGNLVNCNNTTNTTDGIEFAGGCNGASFSQNTMSGNLYGFVLSSSGQTGPLGSTNVATDNKWNGTWPLGVRYKTATLTSSAINNELWVRGPGAGILNPNGSGYTFPGINGTDDYFWLSSTIGTIKYVTAAPINPGCPVLSTGGGGTNTPVSNFIQQLEQIALDQLSYAPNQAAQARFINKANLLGMLKGDPSLTTTSPILQTFTATSVNTSRDKFTIVEDQTSKGNLAAAGSINASISPTISIESNHKDFYNTLLNYANNTLTTSDSITVINLSNGCPFTDGSAVYQARALYNVMYDTYQVFLDNCEENTSSRLMKPKEEEVKDISTLFDAVIFPNPGTTNFNIATFGLTEGAVDLTISDITGKVVFDSKLQIANALTDFTIDVKGGIYFVKIYDVTLNKTLIKKLVVQQ